MTSSVVPVRLDEKDIRQIELLVELGIFGSRSEALRELIRLGVKSLSEVPEVLAIVERLFELEKEKGEIPIQLPGATKRLLEERGRN